jgi:hypothetical protein
LQFSINIGIELVGTYSSLSLTTNPSLIKSSKDLGIIGSCFFSALAELSVVRFSHNHLLEFVLL